MLNFDIIIIIIMLFAIIHGLIRGFYRQIIALLSILIPSLIVIFSGKMIANILKDISWTNTILKACFSVVKMIANFSYDGFVLWFNNIILFFILFLLLRLVLNRYFLNTKKLLSIKVTAKSRYLGGGIGLIIGLCFILYIYLLIKPMVSINDQATLTRLFLSIYKPLQSFIG